MLQPDDSTSFAALRPHSAPAPTNAATHIAAAAIEYCDDTNRAAMRLEGNGELLDAVHP
jgi:hypothetical protein